MSEEDTIPLANVAAFCYPAAITECGVRSPALVMNIVVGELSVSVAVRIHI